MAGQARARSEVATSTLAPDDCSGSSYFCNADIPQIAVVGQGRMHMGDSVAGVLAGYNHSVGPLVLGVEADYSALDSRDTRQSGAYYTEPWAINNRFNIRQRAAAYGLFTIRGRLGYSLDKALLYVTAGAAATRLSLKDSFSDDYSDGAQGSASRSATRWGWVWGAGAQYAITERWSLRADYLHADFGALRTSSDNLQAGYLGVTTQYPGNVFQHKMDFNIDMLRFGISYDF